MKLPKVFFGWSNFKNLIIEFQKVLHKDESSIFSLKRIQTAFAFGVAQWGMIHWLVLNVTKIDVYAIVLWAATEFAIAGYTLNKIEQLKKPISSDGTNTN